MAEIKAHKAASRSRVGWRRAFVAAAAVAALSIPVLPSPAAADTLTGAFLAARQAMRQHDSAAAAHYFERAAKLRPGDPVFRERAIFFRAANGDVAVAESYAQSLIRLAPSNRIAQMVLAAKALRQDRPKDAAALIAGRGQGGAGRLLRRLLSAWIAAAEADRDAAEGHLGQVGEQPFFKLIGRYHAALLAAQEADWAASAAAFEEAAALVRAPTARMALGYAAVLQRLDKPREAAEILDAAFAEDPTDATLNAARKALAKGDELALTVGAPVEGAAEAFYDIGLALAQENERTFGLFYVRLAVALRPDFVEATILAGEIQERQGQHAAAAAIYAQVPPSSPKYGSAQVRRAVALARLGREDEGLEALRSLAARSPEDPGVHFAMGDFFQRSKDFAGCIRSYEEGLKRLEEIGPRYWLSFYRLGACYERAGQWESAEKNLRRALELRPNQAEVLNYLGYSMVEQGVRLDEATALIKKAVAASPQSGYIVDSLGWALYRAGDFAASVEQLEKAAELEPTEPVINDHLGDALWRVGRKTEARFHWRRALSFNPEDKDKARIERKLDVGLDKVLEEESAAKPETDQAEQTGQKPAQGG